ncbi:MAG: SulP family inorganic anion transporter [Lachnospiraceae bacterium]|nr:SulP family inorganic anion transporter [Lachnospiraceae bacterium]
MNDLKPKIFSVMKTYSKEQFIKDVIAGIIVAIIALPLSIALALASGVSPMMGIYTAIVSGFVAGLFSGSRIQVTGPTAALATLVASVVMKHGINGLAVTTVLAGIILIIMGVCKFGNLIKFIPYTITTGFTAGIAVMIFVGQIASFLGISTASYKGQMIEPIDKIKALIECRATFNPMALLVGVLSLIILIIWPHINKRIPNSLVAVVIASIAVKVLGLDTGDNNVETIGSLYEITTKFPTFTMPEFDMTLIKTLLPDAVTMAVLAGIVSLLSCVVSDGVAGSRHRSNAELVAQGLGNIAVGFFGGIPGTGAIARTTANIKNGGRTPIATMVHAIVLAIMLAFLVPLAKLIPMPTIAAMLFMVAYNMSGLREIIKTLKRAPKSDIALLLTTLVIAVWLGLMEAVGFGLVLASLLFMKRMADVTDITCWTYVDDYTSVNEENENYDEDKDTENISLKAVPKHTLVFEVNGPLFFGAADKINGIALNIEEDILILRMRSVPAMDATALRTLENVFDTCKKNNTVLIFSHVNMQPYSVMEKSGFVEKVGKDKFCKNIDEALSLAESLEKEFHLKRKKKKNV